MERAVAPQSFRAFSLRACRARVVSSARLDKGGEEEGQEKRRDDPSVRHVPSAKIENLGARRGDKGNGCYSHQERRGRREEGDAARFRKRYEIRNWARDTPTAPVCVGRGGWAFCFAREERREVGGSLLCSLPGKSAADVPTRLARARCHLAARKTVPSAPFLVPSLRPSPHLTAAGPPLSLPTLTARVHAVCRHGAVIRNCYQPPQNAHTSTLFIRENGCCWPIGGWNWFGDKVAKTRERNQNCVEFWIFKFT